ncbi:MAG TPA: RNA polymerase sigma-70 factor [Gaiellaceae bacterium]|nr:RNA polymerase sigma-70 factor [Gaiellaceae bacterium]
MPRRDETRLRIEADAGLRPLMFSIAYRMLASVSEAEDVVQEAFLRYQRALAEDAEIESPKAYLSTVVTRLAIDQLRSARARRETYVGEWLPEPLVTDDDDPAARTEEADSLSMAFLLLLERLSPVERAVFLLHDVFGYGYDEVGGIVGKSEANCRQLALRARRHIESEKPRFDASRQKRDELAARFLAAVTEGEVDGLVELLAGDVVVYGDGGGKAPQWAAPIVGVERVASLLAGLGRQLPEYGITVRPLRVNGQPGAAFLDAEGRLVNVWSLDIVDGVVQTVRSVINPDKLQHLGPVADLRALLREGRQEEPPA